MQPIGNSSNAIGDKNSGHLPRDPQERQVLRSIIDQYLAELQNKGGDVHKIDVLKLRKRLLDSHGLNIERIDNLQSIFLYYCTQVFKTANKQITFERMQYEKSHLTMERFFAFLKDFNLTTAVIEGTLREIVDKNQIVLLFKKASINCKDVSFEQFITLLEKIGVLYYDSKGNYKAKMQKIARERQRRKETNLKNQQRRKAALEAAKHQLTRGGEMMQKQQRLQADNDDKQTVQEQKREEIEQQQQMHVPSQTQHHENDNFVTALMNDANLEDPQQQIMAQLQMIEGDGQQVVDVSLPLQHPPNIKEIDTVDNDRQELLILTTEQKIEYFYQIIDVDDSISFRRKMKELNMELLHSKNRKVSTQIEKARDIKTPNVEDFSDQKRLQQIRTRLKEKEQKQKKDRSYSHISPRQQPQPKQYQTTKRKQKDELDIGRKHIIKSKKIELSDLSIDLSSLSKISSDQINFGKFNPKKFTTEQADPYLDDYFSVNHQQRNQKRVLSHLQSNDRTFELIQQKLKRRTQELQLLDKNQETKYVINQNMGVSIGSQSRKNRLLQKLVKLQRE